MLDLAVDGVPVPGQNKLAHLWPALSGQPAFNHTLMMSPWQALVCGSSHDCDPSLHDDLAALGIGVHALPKPPFVAGQQLFVALFGVEVVTAAHHALGFEQDRVVPNNRQRRHTYVKLACKLGSMALCVAPLAPSAPRPQILTRP